MFVLKMLLELILLGVLGAGVYLGLKVGFVSIMAPPRKRGGQGAFRPFQRCDKLEFYNGYINRKEEINWHYMQ